MKEAESAAAFAREHKNPMALVKATELRAKLSGLLIDRLEVVPPDDLKAALLEARTRVINTIDLTLPHANEEVSASERLMAADPARRVSADGANAWRPFNE